MKRLKNALTKIKAKDLVAPFVFLLLLLPSVFLRIKNNLKKRELWLVAEEGDARDNGYYFYKYIREKHPDNFCFYAIKPESVGYKKVVDLGNVIKFGGLRHWLYYMSADLNISSQKSGNPCPIFWYFIHVVLGLYRNRVFLQHGVIKDDLKFTYQNKTKFKYFICGAKREYDYILKNFGYIRDNLILSGLPRWDTLKDSSRNNKNVLIMPTWRDWLGGDKNFLFETKDIEKTDFFKCWNDFLSDKKLIEFIEDNGITIYFYPHINMQKFLEFFRPLSKNIKILSKEHDIQKYIEKSNLMITDYSSAVFDFALLRKPVLYYQFDLKEYREKQYPEGYFDYEKDGFGKVVKSKDALVECIVDCANHNFKNESSYLKREDKFFMKNDRRNCERIYEAIK